MKYKRGDIVLVLFPDSNLRTAKRRPALIVQADNIQSGFSQFIIAMVTSNMNRAGHRSRVSLSIATQQGRSSGLKTDSVLMTDNLATVFSSEIDQVLGSWTEMTSVDNALRFTFGL